MVARGEALPLEGEIEVGMYVIRNGGKGDPIGSVSATPASEPGKVVINMRFGPAREFNRAELERY